MHQSSIQQQQHWHVARQGPAGCLAVLTETLWGSTVSSLSSQYLPARSEQLLIKAFPWIVQPRVVRGLLPLSFWFYEESVYSIRNGFFLHVPSPRQGHLCMVLRRATELLIFDSGGFRWSLEAHSRQKVKIVVGRACKGGTAVLIHHLHLKCMCLYGSASNAGTCICIMSIQGFSEHA